MLGTQGEKIRKEWHSPQILLNFFYLIKQEWQRKIVPKKRKMILIFLKDWGVGSDFVKGRCFNLWNLKSVMQTLLSYLPTHATSHPPKTRMVTIRNGLSRAFIAFTINFSKKIPKEKIFRVCSLTFRFKIIPLTEAYKVQTTTSVVLFPGQTSRLYH